MALEVGFSGNGGHSDSDGLYRAVLSQISDAVLLTDDSGEFIFVGGNIESTFGCSESEIRSFGNIKNLFGELSDAVNPPADSGCRKNISAEVRGGTGAVHALLIDVKHVSIGEGTVLYTCRGVSASPEELRMLRSRLKTARELINAVPVPIFYKDAQGVYLGCNTAFEKLMGVSRECLIGKTVYEVSPDVLAAVYQSKDSELLRTRRVQVYESRLRDVHGRFHDVIYNKALFSRPDGEFFGIVGAIFDTTEHKRIVKALRESEQRFDIIAEAVQDVFWISSPDCDKIYYVSPAYEKVFGKSCGSLYSSPLSFLDVVHPEDRGRLLAQLGQRRVRWESEFRIIQPGGAVRWIHDRGYPVFDDAGRLCYLVGVAGDITERKDAEDALRESGKRLKSILDHSPQGIFIKDLQSRYTFVNSGIKKLFSRNHEKLEAKTSESLFEETVTDRYLRQEKAVLETLTPLTSEEDVPLPDGNRAILSNIFPLLNASGEPYALCGMVMDITERKQVENEKETMVEVLHLINSAKSTRELLKGIACFLEEKFGCDALGIRLKDGDDFPFAWTYGLSKEFLAAESNHERAGSRIEPDADNAPPGDYLCDGILRGCIDPALPTYTQNGSFWTNSVSELQESGTGKLKECRWLAQGYESLAMVPLKVGGDTLGLMQLGFCRPGRLTGRQLVLMERVANNLAVALAHRRAEEALQRAHDELALRVQERTAELMKSNSMLRALGSAQWHYIAGAHPTRFLGSLLEDILSLTDSDSGFIGEVLSGEGGRQYVRMHAFCGAGSTELSRDCVRPHDGLEFDLDTFFGTAIASGKPVISNDPAADPRCMGIPAGHPRLESFLGLPIHRRGELVGIIGLANRPQGYDEQLIQYLNPVVVRCGALVDAYRNEIRRKAAEEALRESEKRFRSIFDNSPLMMHSVDERGCLVGVNKKWLEETGYRQDEVIGRRIEETMIAEADRSEFAAGYYRLWRDGHLKDLTVQFVRRNGSVMNVLINSAITVDPKGHKIGIAVVENLTERKRAEEQIRKSRSMLRMVFDGISEPLLMLDRHNMVRMINRAAKDYYMLSRYSDAIGKPCYAGLLRKSAQCEGCEHPFSAIRGFEGTYERQSAMHPDRLEQVVVYSKQDESGETEATIVRITDITHAKILERQLVQNEKLASLGLLVSGMAHEINNPNSFISFNIPILRDYLQAMLPIVEAHAAQCPGFQLFGMSFPEFEKDIFKLLENMEHGSSRINATITRLKEFVRKREKPEREMVDIRQVIERSVALCLPEIRKKVKSFNVDIADGIPLIYADPESLEQILVNLLINAVHASDKEESTVHLRAIPGRNQLCRCAIEVSDNGCGMDEKTRQKVFDPFFTTKSPGLGTGLGLYVCHNLIEGLGGKIEVESRPGEGSTFRIILYEMGALKSGALTRVSPAAESNAAAPACIPGVSVNGHSE